MPKAKKKRETVPPSSPTQSDEYKALALFTLEQLKRIGGPDQSAEFLSMLCALIVYSSGGRTQEGERDYAQDAKEFMEGIVETVVNAITEMVATGKMPK